MNFTTAHQIFKEHGITFTLQIDPSVLPFGHIAHFTALGLGDGLCAVSVPPQIKAIRSPTTHIHPDVITNEIWQTLKDPKVFLTILQIGSPLTIVQVQEDDTILVRSITHEN